MKNQKDTIRKMVSYLNNDDKDGGFWLPNIQRPFVWNEEQIERLFDSIMREYPISTLLVWRTNSEIKRRKFIDTYRNTLKLTDYQLLPLWTGRAVNFVTSGSGWPFFHSPWEKSGMSHGLSR